MPDSPVAVLPHAPNASPTRRMTAPMPPLRVTRRVRVLLIGGLALSIALAGCGGSPSSPNGEDDPSLPAAPVPQSPAEGSQAGSDTPSLTVRNARGFNTSSAQYTFEVTTRSGARTVATVTVSAGRGTTSATFAAPLPRG